MKKYKLLIAGSISPQLTCEFSMASDAMAMDYCKRVIPDMTSRHYWTFVLFCIDEDNPHHVVSFNAKLTVVVEAL